MLSYTVIFSMSGRVSGRKVPVIISERKGHDTRIQYQQSCRLWQNISFIWYHHFWKYLPQVYMNCCLNCPSFDLNPQKGYVLETLGFSHDDRNTKCCAYMMARVQMCASPVLYFTISRIFCGQQESMCNVCMHWMYWNLGWVPFVPSFFSPLFFIITNQIFLFYFSATLQRTSCGLLFVHMLSVWTVFFFLLSNYLSHTELSLLFSLRYFHENPTVWLPSTASFCYLIDCWLVNTCPHHFLCEVALSLPCD